MRHWIFTLLFIALPLTACAERHDDDDDDGPARTSSAVKAASNPLYQQECGSCHLAYPARLLPATSWKAMMADLKHHFGEDASLNEADTRSVASYLQSHAGHRAVSQEAPLRISKSPWFVHEHDEVRASVWSRPAIKTAANCQACHRKADQGSFRERDIQIPR